MHKIALMLACLACGGHGRRGRLTSKQIQEDSYEKHHNSQRAGSTGSSSHSFSELEQSVTTTRSGIREPLKLLAMLLLAINNSGAYALRRPLLKTDGSGRKLSVKKPVRTGLHSGIEMKQSDDIDRTAEERLAMIRSMRQSDEDFPSDHERRKKRALVEGRKNARASELMSQLTQWVEGPKQLPPSEMDSMFDQLGLYDFDKVDELNDHVDALMSGQPEMPEIKDGGVEGERFLEGGEISAGRRPTRSSPFGTVSTFLRTVPPRARRKNAQVVILREDASQLSVLLQLRSYSSRAMPGHLAAVGGTRDKQDKDSAETALREVYEEAGLADVGLVEGAPEWLRERAAKSGALRPRAFIKFKQTLNVDWWALLLDGPGTFDVARDTSSCADVKALVPKLKDAEVAPCFGHAWVSPYGVQHIMDSNEVPLMAGLQWSVNQAVAALVYRGAVVLGSTSLSWTDWETRDKKLWIQWTWDKEKRTWELIGDD